MQIVMSQYRLVIVAVCLVSSIAAGSELPDVRETSVEDAIIGLNSRDEKIRFESVQELERLTQDVSEFGGDCCEAEAIAANQRYHEEAKPLVDHLIAALKSADPEIVSTAATALAKLGADGRKALPALQTLFQDQKASAETKFHVFVALLHVTPKDKSLVQSLLGRWRDLPKEQRVEIEDLSNEATEGPFQGERFGHSGIVCAGLLICADRTTVEVPHLIKATSPEFPLAVRVIAIDVLSHLAWDAESAIPSLRMLLNDENKLVRGNAAHALVRIERNPELLPPLLRALNFGHQEETSFREAAEVLLTRNLRRWQSPLVGKQLFVRNREDMMAFELP